MPIPSRSSLSSPNGRLTSASPLHLARSLSQPGPPPASHSTSTPIALNPAPTQRPDRVVLLISLWLALACNLPLWTALLDRPGGTLGQRLLLCAAMAVIVTCGNVLLLSLWAWRATLKPAIVITVLAAALGAYFMQAYGIVIDASMLTNLLQTDPGEARDLLSLKLMGTVLLLAGLPLWWLHRQHLVWSSPARTAWRNLLRSLAAIALAVVALLAVFQDFASTMRNEPRLRYLINPLNSVYALGHLATEPLRVNKTRLLPLGRDAHLGASYAAQTKPPLLVLVVGETARSGNFGINGYGRDTTPLLAARQDIASATLAWSCGTSTAASLPCMFSHLGHEGYATRSNNYETLIDVLHHAGLAVLWVDNQSGCKGVCDRIGSTNTQDASKNPPDPAWCTPGSDCLDSVMLSHLDERIAALPADQRARGTVVVLHQMGSHGPAYYKRSAPARKLFAPECTSPNLQDCERQQVVNAYDNSIREVDYFLDSTINWLEVGMKQYNTAMLYVADHGESLGENNLYLHGLPYAVAPDVQKQIPWLTWLSPAMQQRTGAATSCLRKDQSTRHISHDNYFHTVLGLMDVQTSVYQPALDLLHGCRPPAQHAIATKP